MRAFDPKDLVLGIHFFDEIDRREPFTSWLTPTIRRIRPTRCSIGGKIRIYGENLAIVNEVRFGSRKAEFIIKKGVVVAILPDVKGSPLENIMVISDAGFALSKQVIRVEYEDNRPY